jgi:hypothetical protein
MNPADTVCLSISDQVFDQKSKTWTEMGRKSIRTPSGCVGECNLQGKSGKWWLTWQIILSVSKWQVVVKVADNCNCWYVNLAERLKYKLRLACFNFLHHIILLYF